MARAAADEVDLRDDRLVGRAEAGREVLQQETGPAVLVRLEDAEEPARRLLNRSFGAFLARARNDEEWAQSRLEAALAVRRADPAAAHLSVVVVAILGSAGILVVARRDPELGFGLTILVALLASPISWLNYYALLLVPVALTSRRLSGWWLLLLAFWAAPQPYSGGSTWHVVVPIAVATAATLGRYAAGSLIRWSPLRGVAQPG